MICIIIFLFLLYVLLLNPNECQLGCYAEATFRGSLGGRCRRKWKKSQRYIRWAQRLDIKGIPRAQSIPTNTQLLKMHAILIFLLSILVVVHASSLGYGTKDELATYGDTFKSLHQIKIHFDGGEWTSDVDGYNGTKHIFMKH